MSKPFRTIWQGEDSFSELFVLDNGLHRLLSFGENDEQTKLSKALHYQPQHTYVQAMLLALLFIQPKSAIILGLGGGALVHALRHYDKGIKLTAVELRSQVLELAQRYFAIQSSKKLQLINQDAVDFVMAGQHKKVDIIFADIYTKDGVDQRQLSASFFDASLTLLKSNGLLVLNCWKEHSFAEDLLFLLHQRFAQVYACLTSGGNWVVFAAKQAGLLTSQGLKSAADELTDKLDYSVSRSLSRFQPWE